MITNQFKIAFRNLKKNASFSIINILGLSLGMTCCFLIILYYLHESSYDTFHQDGDQICRLEYTITRGNTITTARNPSPISPILKDYFPEIEASSRFYPRSLSIELSESQEQFEIEEVYFVDSTAVDVFQFDFLHGNPKMALHRPDGVVITDDLALRLFGHSNVLGKSLKLAGEKGFNISGVVKSWPDNSHLAFNMLLPFETMIKVEPEHARDRIKSFVENNWSATHSYTYVKLQPNQNIEKINAKFKNFVNDNIEEGRRDLMAFNLIPIKDIHLYAKSKGPKPSGNLNYLYLFLLIGGLTLLIACINFINISTASSIVRAKEVGVRKVLGAQRMTLITQFLIESIFLSLFSFFISIGLTILALPYLNDLTGISIAIDRLFQASVFCTFIGISVLTGFLAGLYPAFFITRFKAVDVFKGMMNTRQKSWNTWLRKGLITLQFVAAIGFVAGSITLYLQIDYLSNQPLGFNEELILSIPLDSEKNLNGVLRPGNVTLRQRMNTFDESLMTHPNIKAVTQCSKLPGLGAVSKGLSTENIPSSEQLAAATLSVDYDFTETFELEVLAGRDFDASYGTDHTNAFLINEKALTLLQWENPESAIGQALQFGEKEGMVVGVLKDFHFESLHSEINPLVMEVNTGAFGYFAMRIENSNIQETLGILEQEWKKSFPEKGFEYTFLEESLTEAYQAESRLSKVIGYFAFIAILISCFGLFGLAALLTQQRFKEIGIRKILGASVGQILHLLSKDFVPLILLALILVTPITWYFVTNWLSDFAYRIDFPWWVTIISGLGVMIIAFFTISSQSIRAALLNPVDAIKNE